MRALDQGSSTAGEPAFVVDRQLPVSLIRWERHRYKAPESMPPFL
jgi:hypothetical protein